MMRVVLAPAALLAGCGPGAFGEVDGHTLDEVGSAVAAYHQDGRGMYIASDMPDLCDRLGANPSDPPDGDYWVVSATTLDPAARGVEHAAAGFVGVSTGGVVSEYVADEAYVTVRYQDGTAAEPFVRLVFADGSVQGSFSAELCATSALFIGSE